MPRCPKQIEHCGCVDHGQTDLEITDVFFFCLFIRMRILLLESLISWWTPRSFLNMSPQEHRTNFRNFTPSSRKRLRNSLISDLTTGSERGYLSTTKKHTIEEKIL